MNLNDYLADESIYKVQTILNHPDYFEVEENVHVIKNFTTQEERDWFVAIAEAGTGEQWDSDKRIWWNNKILYVGDENSQHPIIKNVMDRIRSLFDDSREEKWSFGGLITVHRMQPGEAMFEHADNPSGTDGTTNYVQFGMVLYHNDFNGGEIVYKNIGINYKPEKGDLLMHPGTTKYTHYTLPVLGGPNRYVSTTFAFDPAVKRLRDKKMVFENIETGEAEGVSDPVFLYQKNSKKQGLAPTPTIYLALTAFNERDGFIKLTVGSALSNASIPSRIKFGINYVSSDSCFDDLSEFENNVQVIYGITPKPLGLGISRCVADSFYNKEDYYLQIDAHMLFAPEWDLHLINAYETLKIQYLIEKPIISTFMPWWSMDDLGNIIDYRPGDVNCCQSGNLDSGYVDAVWTEPRQSGVMNSVCGEDFKEHHSISGHFLFASGAWLEEIGHNPNSVFLGDETMIALRSWTRGYRIFAYGIPLLWHYHKTIHGSRDWHTLSNFNVRHKEDSIEKRNIREYLLGEKFDRFGAPSRELLNAYQVATGLDYAEIYKKIDSLRLRSQ